MNPDSGPNPDVISTSWMGMVARCYPHHVYCSDFPLGSTVCLDNFGSEGCDWVDNQWVFLDGGRWTQAGGHFYFRTAPDAIMFKMLVGG